MFDKIIAKIPAQIWPLLIMALWGGAILWLGLVRLDTFGMDEGAAVALLLNWSVSDQVASPVTIFGGPDLRALLFVPLGAYWSGSILAAKVFTLITTFAALFVLYRWRLQQADDYNDETALIATGLMLVTPVILGLADSISVGPYLLLLFGLGWVVDKKYRASPHRISSLYFVQTLLVAITVTLHPMGLAYPLALALRWQQDPKSELQKRQVWIGIALATGIVMVMRLGWIDIHWYSNPLTSLSYAILGNRSSDPQMISPWPGLIPAVLLVTVLAMSWRQMLNNLLGINLLLALLIGLLAADFNWALLALVIILYYGIPLLIRANLALGGRAGFIGQRGLVMVALLICAIVFMQADKLRRAQISSGILTPVDELIQVLIPEAANKDNRFLAASQWPARTMITVRGDVLPLPHATADGPSQLEIMRGITHVIFDQNDPDNSQLARNFSELPGEISTLARLPGGVILKIRDIPEAQVKPTPSTAVKGDMPAVPTPDTPGQAKDN